MKGSEQQYVSPTVIKGEEISARFKSAKNNEVRFWQNVALSLAIFVAGLIASLLISLIMMLASK